VGDGYTLRKRRILRIAGLGGARRLILSITDAEGGNRGGLARWVDRKLFLRD
jgi:hypothetical protein